MYAGQRRERHHELERRKNRYSYTVLDIELERGLERRLEALGLTWEPAFRF